MPGTNGHVPFISPVHPHASDVWPGCVLCGREGGPARPAGVHLPPQGTRTQGGRGWRPLALRPGIGGERGAEGIQGGQWLPCRSGARETPLTTWLTGATNQNYVRMWHAQEGSKMRNLNLIRGNLRQTQMKGLSTK